MEGLFYLIYVAIHLPLRLKADPDKRESVQGNPYITIKRIQHQEGNVIL